MYPLPRRLARALAALALCCVAGAAFGDDFSAGALRIDHPYARPTPPGARTGAAYFTVRNVGNTADRLLGATTSAAKSVELHSMSMEGNVMKMRAVPGIDIPAGGRVAFAPNGYHAMLVDLAQPLKVGDKIPLTLRFEHGGAVSIVAAVEGSMQ